MNEPITVQAALVSAVNLTLGLLGLLFDWPQETMSVLIAVSGAWITLAAIVLGRSQVVPTVKVDTIMDNRGQPNITSEEYKAA